MQVHHIPNRTVKCSQCGAKFTFSGIDVSRSFNMWGSLTMATVDCPNTLCRRQLIVKDERFFLVRFISWSEQWYGKVLPVTELN